MKKLSTAVVEFIVGGAFHARAQNSSPSVTVIVDSWQELNRIPDLPHLVKIALGRGDTVLALLERLRENAPESSDILEHVLVLLEEYRQKPNVYLAHGMAADGRIGRLAVLDLFFRGKLESVFHEIYIRLMEGSNGRLHQVEIRELNSLCGGTGSLGASEISQLFRSFLRERIEVPVRCYQLRLGGLTYASVTSKGFTNVQRSLDVTARLIGMPSDKGLFFNVEFYELPLRDESGQAIRENREIRDSLAGSLLQARLSSEVVDLVDAREVNHRSHPLSVVLRGQACWSRPLETSWIVESAAAYYRQELESVRREMARPDTDDLKDIDVRIEEGDPLFAGREQFRQLIREQDQIGLQQEVLDQPQQEMPGKVLLTVSGELVSLQLFTRMANAPRSLQEMILAGRRYRGALKLVELAIQDEEAACKKAERTFQARQAKLVKEIRGLGSTLRMLKGALLGRRRIDGVTELRVKDFVESHQQLSRAESGMRLLKEAVKSLQDAIAEHERRWLGTLERFFGESQPDLFRQDLVAFKPLDDRFEDLLAGALELEGEEAAPSENERSMLLRSVSHVTMAGLARMLCCEMDAHSMIAALEGEDVFEFVSPPWGGMVDLEEPRHRLMVLPPMRTSDRNLLEQASAQLGFQWLLCSSDSVASGCLIVALELSPIRQMDQLIPQVYSSAQEAKPSVVS